MAFTGDAVITRRLSVYKEPDFLHMIDLVRNADVAFTNAEILFHDYEPYPMHESGGTYLRAEPELAKELAWAGFDLVSLANNHTGDYGVEGMRLTQKYVREAGLVAAGTGENLSEAREARFVETALGRVALIAVASTFPAHSAAGRPKGAIRGRPGLNPLRFSHRRIVPQEAFESLRQAVLAAGVDVPNQGIFFNLFGEVFEVGEAVGVRTEPDSVDVREIAAVVGSAARLADYVIVSLHTHEQGDSHLEAAEFVVTFAHAMIDAGADVVAGHGPHYLRGIEIYRGKPIFYSLGNFIFANETLLRLPDENYSKYGLDKSKQVADFNTIRFSNDTRGFPSNREIWESVIAVVRWQGKELEAIDLHPIALGFGTPSHVRGRPVLADQEAGKKIMATLAEISRAMGTTIEWKDGIGRICVPRKR